MSEFELTLPELCELLGYGQSTLRVYRRRFKDFPPPKYERHGLRFYDRDEVVAWDTRRQKRAKETPK